MVFRRKSANWSLFSVQISAPLTTTLPALGRRMPESMLSIVVLPLPEGPTMNNISPK